MLLVIDCGNTNTVISIFEDFEKVVAKKVAAKEVATKKVATWRMATDTKQTADDHAVWLDLHLKKAGLSEVVLSGAVIGSVVPACLPALKDLATKHLGVEAFVIDSKSTDHGVAIHIDAPEQAGADRIANTAGVAAYQLPAMVIDFGTATTFDMIDADGAYIGGAIAPGVNLSIAALYDAAAQLPLIDPEKWDSNIPIIGRNTIDAMNSGLFYGYVSLVEGMITKLKHATDMTVIATGGLGALFSSIIDMIDYYDPDLTLKGMVSIYKNSKTRSP